VASSEFERLAFEAALRGLDRQERLLDELRGRTATLLAASSLAAAFLGQDAFSDPRPISLAALSLFAFVLSTVVSVYLLMPRKDLVFGASGSATYSNLYAVSADMAEVYRRLAYALDRLWEKNDRRIGKLSRLYGVAAAALVVETLSLAAVLSGTLF
jgi:hypothetical protein